MNAGEVIQAIIRKTGVGLLPDRSTADRLMAGRLDQPVTRIGSTFMATVDVLRRAREKGVDMIITHEPTWFSGADNTGWLEKDPVYLEKKKLIEERDLVIWRFHDYMHMDRDDGIYRGFDRETGWARYRMAPAAPEEDGGEPLPPIGFDGCYEIPETTLAGLAAFLQETFRMPAMRYIGSPEMRVRRVGVLPGGGSLGLGVESMPMRLMRRRNLDVILCGDLTEWTLPAYVRDAAQLGMNRGILVLGHERSEEPGMKHLGAWLADILPGIPVEFLDAEEPFGTFHTLVKKV